MNHQYRVHKYEISKDIDPLKLQEFLNSLEGEVQAVIPHLDRRFTGLGPYAQVDYLLIVEKRTS